MTTGYCMKCKQKVELEQAEEKRTSRGVRMATGLCSLCKGKVSVMLGK